MTNQTLLPVEKRYPQRQPVSDEFTSWEVEASDYEPPVYPEFESVAHNLRELGLEISDEPMLRRLAKLSTEQAVELVGPGIIDIRHPLGRTGINGTGIFWKAGKSRTADIAIIRNEPSFGIQLALIFNRGKWRLPGGFIEPTDDSDLVKTAIREGIEETNIDLSTCSQSVITLIPEQVKPNSRRSADLGYISSQVSAVVLPDVEMSFALAGGDDAEAAAWFDSQEVEINHSDGFISQDHYLYMLQAFGYAENVS